MRKALLILLLVANYTTKAQIVPEVILTIDSGWYSDTISGYSNNPFSFQSHGSYAVIAPDVNPFTYTWVVFAGFPARSDFPKISLIATKFSDPSPWWPSVYSVQLTVHHPTGAKWYGNHLPQGNGQFGITPTGGNAQGPTQFSGEGSAYVMCSTDSTDIKFIEWVCFDVRK